MSNENKTDSGDATEQQAHFDFVSDADFQNTHRSRKAARIFVGASDLSYWLNLSLTAVQSMRTAGKITPDKNGKYDVQEVVRNYIAELKMRRDKTENATTIENETAYWKLQNIKQKNRDWRLQRDRLIATEIVKGITAELGHLRDVAGDCEAVVKAIDAAIEGIGSVDVELVSMAVEGNMEDEE